MDRDQLCLKRADRRCGWISPLVVICAPSAAGQEIRFPPVDFVNGASVGGRMQNIRHGCRLSVGGGAGRHLPAPSTPSHPTNTAAATPPRYLSRFLLLKTRPPRPGCASPPVRPETEAAARLGRARTAGLRSTAHQG